MLNTRGLNIGDVLDSTNTKPEYGPKRLIVTQVTETGINYIYAARLVRTWHYGYESHDSSYWDDMVVVLSLNDTEVMEALLCPISNDA